MMDKNPHHHKQGGRGVAGGMEQTVLGKGLDGMMEDEEMLPHHEPVDLSKFCADAKMSGGENEVSVFY